MDSCKIMDNCDNNKVILIDTSFCVSLFRGMCWHVKEMEPAKRAPSLLEFAKDFFCTISKCCARDNKIHCPECVYNNEIDPENQKSKISWENGSLPWKDIFQKKDELFFSQLGTVLNKHIETANMPFERLSEEEVHIYGYEDSAIFQLAREKNTACGQDIIVVTDDPGLYEHIKGLDLPRVIPMSSLSYLSRYYLCCKLRLNEYVNFFISYLDHLVRRAASLPGNHKIHEKKGGEALRACFDVTRRKKERVERREGLSIEIPDIEEEFLKGGIIGDE